MKLTSGYLNLILRLKDSLGLTRADLIETGSTGCDFDFIRQELEWLSQQASNLESEFSHERSNNLEQINSLKVSSELVEAYATIHRQFNAILQLTELVFFHCEPRKANYYLCIIERATNELYQKIKSSHSGIKKLTRHKTTSPDNKLQFH